MNFGGILYFVDILKDVKNFTDGSCEFFFDLCFDVLIRLLHLVS